MSTNGHESAPTAIGKGKGKASGKPPGKQQASRPKSLDDPWDVGGEWKKFKTDAEFAAAIEKLDIPKPKPQSVEEFCGLKPIWKQDRIIRALKEYREKFEYKFPHGSVSTLNIKEPIAWDTCIGVAKSASGTEGIIFVEFPGKKAVCIKSPPDAAAEMFGTTLAEHLKIRCPKMRAVDRSSAEGEEIYECLCKLAADYDNSAECQNKKSVKEMLNQPILLVIEYLDALELADISTLAGNSTEWCKSALGEVFQNSSEEVLRCSPISNNGRAFLEFVGEVVAFDILVYNYDRLPGVVWTNSRVANPGNIMFDNCDGGATSIDNMANCLRPKHDYFEEFFARVGRLTAEIVLNPNTEHANFAKIRRLFLEGCRAGHGWYGLGVDIGEEGSQIMQNAFLKAVRKIVFGPVGKNEVPGLTLQFFEEIEEDLLDLLPDDLKEEDGRTCICGFDKIDPNFYDRVVDTFRKALTSPQDFIGEDSLEPLQVVDERRGRTFRQAGLAVMAQTTLQKACLQKLQEKKAKLLSMEELVKARQIALVWRKRTKDQQELREQQSQLAALGYAVEPHGTTIQEQQQLRADQKTYPLAMLKVPKPADGWPPGVDSRCREKWLSDEEFEKEFGMSKTDFEAHKGWKQNMLKKEKGLF